MDESTQQFLERFRFYDLGDLPDIALNNRLNILIKPGRASPLR